MSRESYQILGVSEDATDAEIEAQYRALKRKYSEEQWQDGEAGNEAARMLNRLERAYEEIMEERRESKQANEAGANAFEDVADALKHDDISRAQSILDSFNERNAEWHYLQSVVFYRKNWMSECKKQLEIAMQMDPSNAKYRTAYERLNARADYQSQNGGAPHTNPTITPDEEQMGGNFCANCANCCYTYLCVNCLFNLCCGCR